MDNPPPSHLSWLQNRRYIQTFRSAPMMLIDQLDPAILSHSFQPSRLGPMHTPLLSSARSGEAFA